MIQLTIERARQLAVMGQLLDGPRPRELVEVVERLGRGQGPARGRACF